MVANDSDLFAETLQPQQFAVGVKSGMQKMYTAINIHTSHPAHKHHVVGGIDIKNAYQEIERAEILKAIDSNPRWRHLYPVVWATLSPSCVISVIPAKSDNGVIQGDPTASAEFCIGIHEDVVWADSELRRHGGFVIFFADDGRFVGPANEVYRVMREFRRRIKVRLNLDYQQSKCSMWCLDEATKRAFTAEHPNCPYVITTEGIMIAGVPLGTRQYMQTVLKQKTNEVLSETKKLSSMLRCTSLQNLYSMLVYCCNARVHHFAQMLSPSITRRSLQKFDALNLTIASATTGIQYRSQVSMVSRRLRLPSSMNGGTLRSMVDVAPAAFVSNLIAVLPTMIDSRAGNSNKSRPGRAF